MSISRPSIFADFANSGAQLDPRMAYARAAGSNGFATRLDRSGVYRTLQPNVPRFEHAPATGLGLGMDFEAAGANEIRNPRAEGGAAGTPGTQPTNWSFQIPAGLTRQIVGFGVEDGIDYIEVRVSGTVTVAGQFVVLAESITAVAAAPGEFWSASAFFRLVGGTFPANSVMLLVERTAAGGLLASTNVTVSPTNAPLSSQRYSVSRIFDQGTTARAAVTTLATQTLAISTVVDFTIRVGWPQLEKTLFSSTPIIPPVGSAGTSARAAETLTLPLANFPAAGNLALEGCIVASFDAAAMGGVGDAQTLLNLHDGSSANRWQLARVASSNIIRLTSTSGGATGGTVASAALADRARGTVAVAWFGGNIAISLNGAAAVTASGVTFPVGPLTTLSVGTTWNGLLPLLVAMRRLQVFVRAPSNGQLPFLSAI